MSRDIPVAANSMGHGAHTVISLQSAVLGVILVLFFTLGMGRGFGLWIPTLPATLLLPLAILLLKHLANGSPWRLNRNSAALAGCFALFFLAGGISALANGSFAEEWLLYVSAYVAPFVLFLVLQDVQLDDRQRILALLAMSVGASAPLANGLIAYYTEWGIPSGIELLTSRFYQERMLPYMDATFGNVNSTAAYLALIIPPLVYLALNASVNKWQKAVIACVLALALLNVLIVQARTLFLVLALTTVSIFWYLRVRAFRALAITVVVLTLLIQPVLGALDTFFDSFARLTEGSGVDESAFQRVEAMGIGWSTMLDNPLSGVGPGRTALVNPYTSAHQFWLQQGSELGIAGFVAAVLFTLVVIATFARQLMRRPTTAPEISVAFLFGAVSYVCYAILANVPVGEGVANPWIGLFSAYFGIAMSGLRSTAAND